MRIAAALRDVLEPRRDDTGGDANGSDNAPAAHLRFDRQSGYVCPESSLERHNGGGLGYCDRRRRRDPYRVRLRPKAGAVS